MEKKKRVAVITGSRAEYDLLYWLLKELRDDRDVDLQLVVTGMHLSQLFGMTIKEIEKDGFRVVARVPMLNNLDSEQDVAVSIGKGVIGFAGVYEKFHPDIIVVLGDRFEILSAVVAAVPFRIPVAHIHGGEATEGAVDEQIRHAITKMSHIHFTSAKEYADRVIQMGEDPKKVFCTGAMSIDNIYKIKLLKREELLGEMEIETEKPIGVVTFHPATLEKNSALLQVSQLIKALEQFSSIFWVITLPNADMEGQIIRKELDKFAATRSDNVRLFLSLGRKRYLSLLKNAMLMVGNSSSGIIEAPFFRLPVVNIGNRQAGRIRSQNVIDVASGNAQDIVKAIKEAVSLKFKNSLVDLKNPYGKTGVSSRVLKIIKKSLIKKDLIKKHFYNIK